MLPLWPEPAGALCMSCTFSAVTEWALHMNKTLAVGNNQGSASYTQSTSPAHPRRGRKAVSQRFPRTMPLNLGCAQGRLFRDLPWKPVAGCRGGSPPRELRRARGWPLVRRVAAGRGVGALPRSGGGGATEPGPGPPGTARFGARAIVTAVSRVRGMLRAVSFIPGSCLDAEINGEIARIGAQAGRLRRRGEALSVFRKDFPHGLIYQSQQKGPNSSWLHFTYTQWSSRIQG